VACVQPARTSAVTIDKANTSARSVREPVIHPG
jgi:hypothetical protein